MIYVPMLLVQEPPIQSLNDQNPAETELVAIAVYANNTGVPETVATRRIFDGEEQFYFPTEITAGAAKTRLVYRLKLTQWRELLETLTGPGAPEALKQLMIPMLLYLQEKFPDLFGALDYDRSFDPNIYARVLPMQ